MSTLEELSLDELLDTVANRLGIKLELVDRFKEDIRKWKPRKPPGRPNKSRETFNTLRQINFAAMEVLSPANIKKARQLVWADVSLRRTGEDLGDRTHVLAAMTYLNKIKPTRKNLLRRRNRKMTKAQP